MCSKVVRRGACAALAALAVGAICTFLAPTQVWSGWRLHQHLTSAPDVHACKKPVSFGGRLVPRPTSGSATDAHARNAFSLLPSAHPVQADVDGAWEICTDGLGATGARPQHVFSIGAGSDLSFDKALGKFGATVHAFDPSSERLCAEERRQATEASARAPPPPGHNWTAPGGGVPVSENVLFHCLGLADRRESRDQQRAYTKQRTAQRWEMYSLADLMQAFVPPDAATGVASLALLKMDCEGCEWEVLASLLFQPRDNARDEAGGPGIWGDAPPIFGAASDADNLTPDDWVGLGSYSWDPLPPGASPLDRVRQLALEIHLWPPGRHREHSWWRLSTSRNRAWHRILAALEDRGYRKTHVRQNPQSTTEPIGWTGDNMPCCWELSFVNTKFKRGP